MEAQERDIVVPLRVGDGATLYFNASPLHGQHEGGEVEIAGQTSNARDVVAGVRDFAHDLTAELAATGVNKFTVEFGCEMAIESGQVFAVLAKGSAKTSLKVTLEWERPK